MYGGGPETSEGFIRILMDETKSFCAAAAALFDGNFCNVNV